MGSNIYPGQQYPPEGQPPHVGQYQPGEQYPPAAPYSAGPYPSAGQYHPTAQPQQPAQPQPPAGGWHGSEIFEALDKDDYGPPRGYFGDVKVADPIRRIGSLLIDMMLCVFLPSAVGESFGLSNNGLLFVMLVCVALNSVVYAFPRGQTIGKMIVGTQAVRGVKLKRGGYAIVNRGPVVNMFRAAAHSLDFLFWFISIPLIIASGRHRSIGDILTKTVVIRPQVIDRLPAAPPGSATVVR
jgi:uncharacterized RDD family membrane protein YckC